MSNVPPPPAPKFLREVLELEQLDTNLFRSRTNQINVNRSLFGGQILGQGLKAATQTVADALSWTLASASLPVTVAVLCAASMILCMARAVFSPSRHARRRFTTRARRKRT